MMDYLYSGEVRDKTVVSLISPSIMWSISIRLLALVNSPAVSVSGKTVKTTVSKVSALFHPRIKSLGLEFLIEAPFNHTHRDSKQVGGKGCTTSSNSNQSIQVCTSTLSEHEYSVESEYLLDLSHRRGKKPRMIQRMAETNFSYDTRNWVLSKLGTMAYQVLVRHSSTVITTCTSTFRIR